MPGGDLEFLKGQFKALECHLDALISNQVQLSMVDLRKEVTEDKNSCRKEMDKHVAVIRLELERQVERATKRGHVYSFLGGIVGGIVTSAASYFGLSKLP